MLIVAKKTSNVAVKNTRFLCLKCIYSEFSREQPTFQTALKRFPPNLPPSAVLAKARKFIPQ